MKTSAQSEYEFHTFTSPDSATDRTLNYRLLRPETVETDQKYPLVLFLHGAGERGNDNQSQLTHGSGMFTNPVNREKYPAYVIFPQCPPEDYWTFPSRPEQLNGLTFPENPSITPIMKLVKELVDSSVANLAIDPDRIYIIGMSMGAMATYDLVCRFPELFAAAIPICGAVNPERLVYARNTPFYLYHGDKDEVVPVENSRIVYRKLKELGYPVLYKEFVGCNHDSWNPAFNTTGFLEWLFEKKK